MSLPYGLCVGKEVEKVTGYYFHGRIVAEFDTFYTRKKRYVVENSDGWLMIFRADQLAAK